ncbi:proprotein convertase P-domain-containing protein [Hymenobacter ruricola]|uniref:Proprotein convertase P-domain-containing protein n=1 Tax=Hymenobacter ruricola TaxID=2791023 RepID=A0ABS0HZE7_9BACT|nr:proprotein convertase P-domain-containing protein [Hymenobacter ruricola]MBF9219838.1 proprotein convertase P-domain-containing protein [Hymenobacter ruricola]
MNPFFRSVACAIGLLAAGLRPAAASAPARAAVLAPAPTITSFSPSYGVPGTVITITGTDFTAATNVSLNGVSVNFTVVSATSITATVPTINAATGLLRVASLDGLGSSATPFTVVTNTPANCGLNIPIADVSVTDVPLYVSGVAGTLGAGLTLTSVDLSLFHTWDSDLEISLISPAGQRVVLSSHNGGRDDNYGNPFNCPTEVTHFVDAAPVAVGDGASPFIGSFRPQFPLTGFSTGPANGVWTLRLEDTSGGDRGNLQYVKLNFTAPPADLVVNTAATIPAGTYHNITVTGTGDAVLGGPVVVEGELLVQSGGLLRPGCQPLTGPGAFTLAAGAALFICDATGITASGSNGAVQVTGPRTFSPDANYHYIGPGVQYTGSGLPPTVRTLTQTGGNLLHLSNNLQVTQTLDLINGTLETSGRYVTIGPAGMLNESANGYLLGVVVTTQSLTTNALSNLGGLGLTLTPDPASPTAPGNVAVSRITGTAVTAGSNHGIERYYILQPANPISNATLTFAYAQTELQGLAETDLSLFRSTTFGASTWQSLGATSRDATANAVTVTGVNQFGFLTLASAAAPLPVELAAFTAQPSGSGVALAWRTASEKNSATFEVERSLGGQVFERIGTVAAQGTTAQLTDYRFMDSQCPLEATTLYYRLRQVDRDGTAVYSPVRTASRSASSVPNQLLAYPNPAHGAVRVRLVGSLVAAQLQVFDALGRQVHSQPAPVAGTEVLMPLSGLPAGMYTLRCGAMSQRLTLE